MKIPTIILCGGIGYRLKEETEFKPKPMIEIGGKPILWHIMKIYNHHGFDTFIVALGYKGNLIKDYFVGKKYYDGDFTLDARSGKIRHHKTRNGDHFKITFVDTGMESLTGERVRRLKKYIRSDIFMVTYGDGLSNIDIKALIRHHKKSRAWVTVTAVHPLLKYGGFELDKHGNVKNFDKRAVLRQLINGGYMVFNKKVLEMIPKDSMIEDIFEELIAKDRLQVFEHKDFFQAMDTYQDVNDLNDRWKGEEPAPWKIWS